jgi:hypothetical protein
MQSILIARAVFDEVIAELQRDFEVDANQSDVILTPDRLAERLQGKTACWRAVPVSR